MPTKRPVLPSPARVAWPARLALALLLGTTACKDSNTNQRDSANATSDRADGAIALITDARPPDGPGSVASDAGPSAPDGPPASRDASPSPDAARDTTLALDGAPLDAPRPATDVLLAMADASTDTAALANPKRLWFQGPESALHLSESEPQVPF